jgi:hypothetical protein
VRLGLNVEGEGRAPGTCCFMERAMTVPRQSRGEGHGEGDDSTKAEGR